MPEHALRHVPVLVQEVLTALNPRPQGVYVDCTFGRGGHAQALLERLGPQGRILALDQDPEAIRAGAALAARDSRLSLEQAPFSALEHVTKAHGVFGKAVGILFDLGVSSPQLDDSARGFGFRDDGPLDMRMNPDSGVSAREWLGETDERDIADALRQFGEERYAKRIARAIVNMRAERPIETTRQLADIVAKASPTREREKHPATRTFQAIRIAVNRELDELREALAQVPDVLAPLGRLAVISFHSLEDRLVKRFIRGSSRDADVPSKLPVTGAPAAGPMRPLGKPIRPSAAEISANPRARSAVLRVAERRA